VSRSFQNEISFRDLAREGIEVGSFRQRRHSEELQNKFSELLKYKMKRSKSIINSAVSPFRREIVRSFLQSMDPVDRSANLSLVRHSKNMTFADLVKAASD